MLKIPPPGGGAPEHRGGQGRLPHLCHHVPRVRMQRTLRRGSGHIQYVRARQNQHQGRWNKVSMCMCNAGYVVDPATFSMYVRARTNVKVGGKRSQCACATRAMSWIRPHSACTTVRALQDQHQGKKRIKDSMSNRTMIMCVMTHEP